jgi:hypothetical protein
VLDVIATLCGLRHDTMTLSERHIKAYDAEAPPEPVPHEDRFASQASVGLSIEVPEGSHLVVYPYDETDINPYNVSAAYLTSLPAHRRPELALKGAREIVVQDKPGDVMVFPGNRLWHLRRRPARAVNLYLKVKDFDCDPLGEDPATAERRRATLAPWLTRMGASIVLCRFCRAAWTRSAASTCATGMRSFRHACGTRDR